MIFVRPLHDDLVLDVGKVVAERVPGGLQTLAVATP